MYPGLFPQIKILYNRKDKFFGRSGYVGVGTVFCPPINIKLEDLESLFATAITKMPVKEEVTERRQLVKISISEKMNEIREKILSRMQITFRNAIVGSKNKVEVIVTFLAMLELVRKNQAIIDQEEMFGDISIKKI